MIKVIHQPKPRQNISIWHKPLSFPYLKKVLQSDIFTTGIIFYPVCFLIAFIVSQIYFIFISFPLGLLLFWVIATPIIAISAYLYHDPDYIPGSLRPLSLGLFTIMVIRLIFTVPAFLASWALLSKMNRMTKRNQESWQLAVIAAGACLVGLYYFLSSIQDWWFLN